MKIFVFVLIIFFSVMNVLSQELDCSIQVSHQKIQGTNVEVFTDMQKDLYEFMNNTKWTDNSFEIDERIECTIMINISQQIGTEKFIGTLSVQARRPVYNSTYYSTLFNFKENTDEFQFEYRQQEPIQFNINTYGSSLASTLAFYAYVIIGLDYATFMPDGGARFFEKAQQIVNNAQSSTEPGWKSYESSKMNNRYWLIENLTNGAYSDLHDFLYKYHRTGFDLLADKIEEGRAQVALSLEHLRAVYRKKPNLYFLQLILSTKSDEIIKLFTESFPAEQAAVYNIMVEIDPANSSNYSKIKGGS